MNEKERIDFIKQEWKKFLKKQLNKDIDISKIESIEEIKKALNIKQAVETISEEYKIDISEEQIVLLSDALIEKTVIDEKGKIKEIKSREGRPYFFSQDTYLMMTRLPFAVLTNELIRFDRPEYIENYKDLNEPIVNKISNSLEKDDIKVVINPDNSTIKGYHLVDIISKGK